MGIIRVLLGIILLVGITKAHSAETQEVEEIDPFDGAQEKMPLGVNAERSRSIELGKIMVTPLRAVTSIREVTENVTIVGSSEIEQLPARNLGEALKYIPGVDIQPRQGFGRATSVSIQGSDSRQVRVMIDGTPLNSQLSGQVDPSQLPLENIERIEVIKGAASSVWGSSLGGVINIITKDTGTTLIPKGSYTNSFAEFRTKKEALDLSGKVGNLGYYQFGSFMESAGKGPRDDVLEKKTFSKVSYDLKESGKIVASLGIAKRMLIVASFPTGHG